MIEAMPAATIAGSSSRACRIAPTPRARSRTAADAPAKPNASSIGEAAGFSMSEREGM
jgi:hypothetical protein